MRLILHSYWRSSASYRVRIGLNIKGLDYDIIGHDLRKDEQRSPDYLEKSSQGFVPALENNGAIITQSGAILHWLEATYPCPALMPRDINDRAYVQSLCDIIACDIHPLNNLRVLKALRRDFAATQDQCDMWAQTWIKDGFSALERMLNIRPIVYDNDMDVGLFECYLIPQLYSARRFGVDLTPYTHLLTIEGKIQNHDAFVRAHPAQQSDADD